MAAVGLDIGTFHTLAVETDGDTERVPRSSIRSIAVDGATLLTGSEALEALDLVDHGLASLILAPKLKLRSPERDTREKVPRILAELARSALRSSGIERPQTLAVTVPPVWDREQCEVMRQALAQVTAADLVFLHEPVALLVAGWHLASRNDAATWGKLCAFGRILVCDWGAGTIDLALVQVRGSLAEPEFQCLGEHTDTTWGGTQIARRTLQLAHVAGARGPASEHDVLLMQQHWEGDSVAGLGFDTVAEHASIARREAADALQPALFELGSRAGEPANTLLVLHGGPLEAPELNAMLVDMISALGIRNHVHLGNRFAVKARQHEPHLRRDALVALGAAVFAEVGEPLPEFAYRLELRDSNGAHVTSAHLEITEYTRGITSVHPPHSGVDYYVGIAQLRAGVPTGIRHELGIFVSPGAILVYRIERAGVGFVSISAEEALDLPRPERLPGGLKRSVELPEKSTRFRLQFKGGRG